VGESTIETYDGLADDEGTVVGFVGTCEVCLINNWRLANACVSEVDDNERTMKYGQ
jgi:hypothetical protein